jgi:putative peptide zinc metalloprotease protein
MLHKVRRRAVQLRYGVVALAILAPLAVPGTAFASVSNSRSAGPATYANLAQATSLRNFYHAFNLRFQVDQGAPTVLNANNQAVALTEKCHNCGAVAIAFQVVFVSDKNLTAINAYNNANATSYSCAECTNIAEAYQIIVATDEQSRLTLQQELGLYRVQAELEGLRWSGLTADQIQSESDALANTAVSIVSNPDYGLPGQAAPAAAPAVSASTLTPAVSGSALPTAMTESTQPVVELYTDVQVST